MEETQIHPQIQKHNHKKRLVKVFLGVLLGVILCTLIGWLLWQLQHCRREHATLENQKQQLETKVNELKSEVAAAKAMSAASSPTAPAATCTDTPTAALKENIKAALDTKNTAVFETYTSNPVKYVLAASEYGGNVTPAQAATSLEYTHSATGPWDFSLPAATIAAWDAGFYTDYFDANTYVGRAASGMVVSFDFDCAGKISQIFVAADQDIL